MAANHLMIITISSLLLFILPLMAAPQKLQSQPVFVEGVVYCLSCKYAGSGSLNEATPIRSAVVSVSCDQVGFYQTNQTDEHGYFYTRLDGSKSKKLGDPIKGCTVKLVSSPLEHCNVKTNLNGGDNGAKLRFEGKVGKSPYAVYYAAGPLAFRPEMCAN